MRSRLGMECRGDQRSRQGQPQPSFASSTREGTRGTRGALTKEGTRGTRGAPAWPTPRPRGPRPCRARSPRRSSAWRRAAPRASLCKHACVRRDTHRCSGVLTSTHKYAAQGAQRHAHSPTALSQHGCAYREHPLGTPKQAGGKRGCAARAPRIFFT